MVHNIPEPILLEAVKHVTEQLASKLAFGFWERDDIGQEIFLLCLDAAQRFELKKSSGQDFPTQLKNFFFIHCRNRIAHLYRDKFHRSDPPCQQCATGEPCSRDGFCERFQQWRERNKAKASLFAAAAGSGPHTGTHPPDPREPVARFLDEPGSRELIASIEAQLPQQYLTDFKRLVAGASFHKGRRAKLLEEVRKILSKLKLGDQFDGQA